jgi:hypothetical protein
MNPKTNPFPWGSISRNPLSSNCSPGNLVRFYCLFRRLLMTVQLKRAAMCFVLFACFVLAMACSSQSPAQKSDADPKTDSHNIIMFVQGGKGSCLLPIQNASSTQSSLSLTRGAVTDATTGSEITGATISLKAESGGQQGNAGGGTQPPQGNPAPHTDHNQGHTGGGGAPNSTEGVTVLPGSTTKVQVNVTGLTGTAWAKVSIFNQDTNIGNLDLVVLDDALNVAIDGLGAAASTPIASASGDKIAVTLKNNSGEFLALECSVELRNSLSSCGNIFLPPTTSKAIAVDLVQDAYSWTDWVQPSAQTGAMKLRMRVPQGTPVEMVPIKVLPLNLTMAGSGPLMLAILSLIYVGLFLALGGYLSILASTILPNMVHKAELRKQVNDLARRTSSVSTRVDSYLRVLLRLERKKIQVLLDNLSGFSPDAAEQFTETSNQIENLQKRLTVAERLDKLRRCFEDSSAVAPPSISDGIDKSLNTAAVQLHSFVLNDTDVSAANTYLDKAEGLLKLLDDNDAQAGLIAQNYVQLRNRLQAFPKEYYTDLKRSLSGIFDSLNIGDAIANVQASTQDPLSGSPGNAGGSGNAGKQVSIPNTANGATTNGSGAAEERAPAANVDSDAPAGNDPVPAANAASLPTEDPAAQEPPASDPPVANPYDFSDPKNIIPPMFFAVDHGIAAIQTTLDYAIVRASVAKRISNSGLDPGQDAINRLKEHQSQLLNLLGTLSWKSLRGAITLVQQMRENVYEEDIYKHLKDRRAEIVFDTQRARPFLPVFFSIAFQDPRINGAAALDWVALDWTFPNELHETGWKICHYFDGKEEMAVVTPQDQADLRQKMTQRTKDKPSENLSIQVEAKSPRWQDSQTLGTTIKVQPENPKADKPRVLADRLRFGIAFGVALAGLKSGALDQLAKLGFVQATVAIVALGFGADTVKNLLTQSSKPQSSPPPTSPSATNPGSGRH